jgi:hypothetical protein
MAWKAYTKIFTILPAQIIFFIDFTIYCTIHNLRKKENSFFILRPNPHAWTGPAQEDARPPTAPPSRARRKLPVSGASPAGDDLTSGGTYP